MTSLLSCADRGPIPDLKTRVKFSGTTKRSGEHARHSRSVPISLPGAGPFIRVAILLLLSVPAAFGQERALEVLPPEELSRLNAVVLDTGVSRQGRPISAVVPREMLDVNHPAPRILLISGLDSDARSIEAVLTEWRRFQTSEATADVRCRFRIGLVPRANPDGLAHQTGAKNSAGGNLRSAWPPTGTAYSDPATSEAHYLWRSIGMLAPDLVVVIVPGDKAVWRVAERGVRLEASVLQRLSSQPLTDERVLAAALAQASPAMAGSIPALELACPSDGSTRFLDQLTAALSDMESLPVSPARRELQRRAARTPVEVATELSRVYGHKLDSVVYIPAMALIGRMRLGELTGDSSHLADVERIVAPYRDGTKLSFTPKDGGSGLSGHLVFGELADRTGNRRYVELARVAANTGFGPDGQPLASMPYHSEMSDAVFMGTPILVQTGRLTGDSKYFDMAARHTRFMLQLNLREDGLHQHSPLDPEHTAWGRGNGFPALGLALSLSDLQENSPHRPALLKAFREHLAAMRPHQDAIGMWHQIVDRPESYREFTVTCMTAFAMTRGMRRGWLGRAEYEPAVRRAWTALKQRIGPDGILVDVCTGTGKQKSRQDYFDRPAILGRDDRGGAMALLISTEIAFAQKEGFLRDE